MIHAGAALLAVLAGAVLLRGAASALRQLSGAASLTAGVWLLARAYLPGALPHDLAGSGSGLGEGAALLTSATGDPVPWMLLLLPALAAGGFLLASRRTPS